MTDVSLSGNFTDNRALKLGGANYFHCKLTNVSLSGNFINNSNYQSGGANCFYNELSNVNISGNFINNTAAYGAVNYFYNTLFNVSLYGNFTSNAAGYYGGANMFYSNVSNCNISGNFINNTAKTFDGGSNFFYAAVSNVSLSGNFINNSAGENGGANYFSKALSNVNLSGNFISNIAGENGGANYFNSTLTNVSVHDSIFINNDLYSKADNISVVDSWFGSNATNYNITPDAGVNVELDNWLFLNATANPNNISLFNSSEVIFELFLYDKNTQTVSDYSNFLFDEVNLTVTSTNGYVNKGTVNFKEIITYTFTDGVTGSVTAAIENAGHTIKINKIQVNPDLSVENQVCSYGENATLTLNYNNSATGKVNISLKGKKYDYSFENIDLNKTITLQSISLDDYNATVTYSGGGGFFNSTANGTLKIIKATIDIQSINELNITYGSQNTITITGKINNTKYGNPYTDNITVTVEV